MLRLYQEHMMSATPDSQASIEWRESPQSEAGGFPDPEPEDSPSQADDGETPEDDERFNWFPDDEEPEPDVSAGDTAPTEVEQVLVADPDPEFHIREIPGGAGHGPARAYGYIAIATALGAQAELTEGGTRSTGAHPLIVTVQSDDETFARINDIYDEVAPVAEQTAAVKRDEARKSGQPLKSYELSLLSRAVLAGFPQGAASALREPGTTRPRPLREATRARLVDEHSYRSAVSSGRAWAHRNLSAASREEHHNSAA
jgi:hypothetical protein